MEAMTTTPIMMAMVRIQRSRNLPNIMLQYHGMQDFQKRRGYKAQLWRMALGLAALAALVAITYLAGQGAWRMYGKFTQAAAAHQAGQARLAELTREHERVAEGVEELGSDRGLEAAVRERYGLARPGEGQIVVVRPEHDELGALEPVGFWQRLWDAFIVW